MSLLQVTWMGLNETSLGELGKEQKAPLDSLHHLPPSCGLQSKVTKSSSSTCSGPCLTGPGMCSGMGGFYGDRVSSFSVALIYTEQDKKNSHL